MKYLLILFLAVSTSFMFACKSEQECCVVFDSTIEVSVVDYNGNDLLNPSTGIFNEQNIEMYYLRNGDKERVFNGSLDNPKNFLIFPFNNRHYLRLFPSEYIKNNASTTYLEFDKVDTDTIKCEFKVEGSKYIPSKIIFNNKLIWNGDGPRYFRIEK